MKIALLDVNVLLALAWSNHQNHAAAHRWFQSDQRHGWATCSLTQLSFVRLSSNPSFTPAAVSPAQAASLLQKWTKHRGHRFWDSMGADEPDIFKFAHGHQQVTDAWLVRLAAENRGRFVTFDAGIAAHSNDSSLVEILSH